MSIEQFRLLIYRLMNNYFKLLLFVPIYGLCLVACGDDDEEITDFTQNIEKPSNDQQPDPEGTITINMTSGSSNNFYDIGLDDVKIHIDANYNFETSIVTKHEFIHYYNSGYYTDNDYYVEFASLGKTNSLKDVASCPATGWSKSLIVIPGTGYVARVMTKSHDSTSDGHFNGRYTRLYVVEQNATTGTIVKYQTPFEVPFTLEKTSVELSHVKVSNPIGSDTYLTGTTVTVQITNGTKDIKVAEKPEWCTVKITNQGSASISASKNPNSQPRTGTVVLKNSVYSASITVTQDVAPAE